MAYTNRHIRIVFDGTMPNPNADRPKDDNGQILRSEYDEAGNLKPIYYPDLGPDIWVQVHNPMLMPQSMLLPDVDVPVNPDGTPVDRRAAIDASKTVIARLVSSWNVYDFFDTTDDPQPLPTPATADMFDRIPNPIGDAIAELLGRARNPR